MAISSAISQIPENTNFLQTAKFTFLLPNLPFMKFFCQSVQMPGVTTSDVIRQTPFHDQYHHGDKLVYDYLTLTFLIDEDLRVWEESYNWLKSLTFPNGFPEYVKNGNGGRPYYDGILSTQTNAFNSNIRIHFKNCHPISLGGISFATSDSPNLTPTADITLRFDIFSFERL